MKLCHLHLSDPYGNPKTLICNLKEGSISYVFYGGHSSSGSSFSLSNLQCTLPVDKLSDKETKEQFVQRIIDTINQKSVCRVVNQVSTLITF
jgi:hypothetical protein